MAIALKILSTDEFDGMQAAWDALLAESAADTLFLRWAWVKTWWDVYGKGRALRVAAVTEGETLLGLLPFYRAAGWPRAWRLCSSDDLWPDYLDAIVRRGREQDVARALAAGFDAAFDGSVLTADNVPADAFLRQWRGAPASFRRRVSVTSRCPRIRLSGDFDSFLKDRFDRKKRYNLQRQLAVALGAQGMTYEEVDDAAGLSRAFDDLFRLHGLRAADKRVKSTFANARAAEFHRRFGRWALDNGLLFFRLLRRGPEAVAALYGFKDREKIYYYQSGMHPAWGRFSVGTVLLTLAVREAFHRGVRQFDFLKGDESYKKSWMTEEATQHAVCLYRDDAAGRLRHGWDRAKAALRQCLTRRSAAPLSRAAEDGAGS